jgi:DNA-binding transcriptional regulator YdaS (Cro superfamily)
MKQTKLKAWMQAASTAQQDQLAKLAKTSRKTLYHLASGERNASAAKAIAIERAAGRVKGAVSLPLLRRGDLSPACAKCDYAQRCLAADQEMVK